MPLSPSKRAAYSDLFEKILDMIFILDPETHGILEINPAAERFLGEFAKIAVGKNVMGLVLPAERAEFEKALRMSMRRYHPRVFESLWRLPSGPGMGLGVPELLPMEILAGKMDLADGSSVLQVIARDISAKKEAETQVKALLAEVQQANRKLHELSIRDAMTGMFNFRFFKQQIEQEHIRASRYEDQYALVFFDLDNFKHYNDRNGHPAGDELIKAVASILRRACRNSDIPARYGGEEFVILCPGVDAQGAKILAERVRSTIESTRFIHSDAQPLGCVSVSVGVAAYPTHGADFETIIRTADEAMYHSKMHGRNQVTVASEETIYSRSA